VKVEITVTCQQLCSQLSFTAQATCLLCSCSNTGTRSVFRQNSSLAFLFLLLFCLHVTVQITDSVGFKSSLPKVIWEEGRVAMEVSDGAVR